MKGKKAIFQFCSVILATTMILCSMIGCGASKASSEMSSMDSNYAMDSTEAAYSEDASYDTGTTEAYAEESADSLTSETTDVGTIQDTSRKLIKTENISAQTKEFDKLINSLEEKVNELNGYVEQSQVYGDNYGYSNNRNASYTIRIPEENLEKFVEQVEADANVTSKSQSVQDVTLDYVDTQSHIDALKTEQDSLMKLMEEADNLDSIIALQSRLTEVRYQLQSYESQMRTYDNQITYSTVYIDITEVDRETAVVDQSFGSQLKERLSDSFYSISTGFKEFALWFLGSLPIIILVVFFLVLFAWIIIRIIYKLIGKKTKRQLRKENNTMLQENNDFYENESQDDFQIPDSEEEQNQNEESEEK